MGQLHPRPGGQLADRALPLGEQFENAHPAGVGQRLEQVCLRLHDGTTRGERHHDTLELDTSVKQAIRTVIRLSSRGAGHPTLSRATGRDTAGPALRNRTGPVNGRTSGDVPLTESGTLLSASAETFPGR